MTALHPKTLTALDDAEQVWITALTNVHPRMYDHASGCGHWTIADLINHVSGGGERYSMLLAGKTAAETSATHSTDYVGDDPGRHFWAHENALRAAAHTADLTASVGHRAGPRTGRKLIDMRIMDLTLHAYDLCTVLRLEWRPTDVLVHYLLGEIPSVIAELRELGLFGSVVTTSSNDPATQLLALAGRPPAAR